MLVRGNKRVRVISWHNCGRSEGGWPWPPCTRNISLISWLFLRKSLSSRACWGCQPIASDLRSYVHGLARERVRGRKGRMLEALMQEIRARRLCSCQGPRDEKRRRGGAELPSLQDSVTFSPLVCVSSFPRSDLCDSGWGWGSSAASCGVILSCYCMKNRLTK